MKSHEPPTSIEQLKTSDLVPYARNAKKHDDAQVSKIAGSIREFGFNNPVLVDGANPPGIIAGHGRVLAAQKLGLETVPCIRLGHLTETQKRAYILADNRLAELGGGWDEELLRLELEDLQALGQNTDDLGFDNFDLNKQTDKEKQEEAKTKLADKWGWTPFSVLNARDGDWQERKRTWIDLGIKSEEGRTADSMPSVQAFSTAKMVKDLNGGPTGTCLDSGTSIFDPVLCEVLYNWFCPPNGSILDPFAGGSVRGIVASHLGRPYTGIDLRAEQIEANRKQWAEIYGERTDTPRPNWIAGDSNIALGSITEEFDFLFTCPPYADLEVYSDDPADISNMPYEEFLAVYREIIAKAAAKLKPNRFAAIVVGEVRDKKNKAGGYYNFVSDTIRAALDAGLTYYNEIILVTAAGTLPLRAGHAFSATRKVGKTHQQALVFSKGCDPASEEFQRSFRLTPGHSNALVFLKGDPREATADLGLTDISPSIDSLQIDALANATEEL